jgi:hypothetical protein
MMTITRRLRRLEDRFIPQESEEGRRLVLLLPRRGQLFWVRPGT